MTQKTNGTRFESVPQGVPVLVSVLEANRITGLGQTYLRRGCKNGTVPHIYIGRRLYINLPQLLELINEQTRKAAGNE